MYATHGMNEKYMQNFCRKIEGNILFRKIGRSWENNVRIHLREAGWEM